MKSATGTTKKRKADDEGGNDKKDFVTGISEDGKVQSLNEVKKAGPLVIPMLERKTIQISAKYMSLAKRKEDLGGGTTQMTRTGLIEMKKEPNSESTTKNCSLCISKF